MMEFHISFKSEIFILSCVEVRGQPGMFSSLTMFEAASLAGYCLGQASWSTQPSGEFSHLYPCFVRALWLWTTLLQLAFFICFLQQNLYLSCLCSPGQSYSTATCEYKLRISTLCFPDCYCGQEVGITYSHDNTNLPSFWVSELLSTTILANSRGK